MGRGRINYCIVYVEGNALELNVNITTNQACDLLTSSGLSAGFTFFHRLLKPESLTCFRTEKVNRSGLTMIRGSADDVNEAFTHYR